MLINFIGYFGSILIVIALFLVTRVKIQPKSLSYLLLNLIGGILLIIYQLQIEAFAGVLLNSIFALVALTGIFSYYKKS